MVITQEIFEAFLHCPTKSYLLSHGAGAYTTPDLARPAWEELFQQTASSMLRAAVPDGGVYTGTPATEVIKRQRYRMIFDCTLQTQDLRARLRGLELVHPPGTKDKNVYVPIRILPTERISAADRLVMAFDAYVFSRAATTPLPHVGKLIHGRELATATVPLAPLYSEVQSVIGTIYAQQASPTPPPLVLNKHCVQCQYVSRCRHIAMEADDLSLLAKINAKERKKYHEHGTFTVTQLSYMFRPRRRIGKYRKHEHALQALAIRKNQIHVIGTIPLTMDGTPVYFDVEGDPDRDFYYCIGLRFEAGGATVQRSHWADSPADEECGQSASGRSMALKPHGWSTTAATRPSFCGK